MSTRTRSALLGLLAALLLVAAAVPDDPLVTQQTHLNAVRAYEAWDVRRGEGAVVAVLDTGVDLDHPDLIGRLVDGIDLVERDTPPDDPQGHGTIVAGIIAANADNARGVAGVAPRTSVMPIRVLDAQGRGTSDVVAEGIRWAVTQQVDVINLSLAEVRSETDRDDDLLGLALVADSEVQRAIREAADAGVLVVAAAGNDGEPRTPYDADAPVLVVGATDADDRVWAESNRDARTIFAPGVRVLSTWHEARYARADGTSFATPIVAAGAAMLMGAGLPADEARTRLEATAVDVGAGLGRVDLAEAVVGLPVAPTPSTTPEPPPPPPTTTPTPTPQAPPPADGGLEEVVPVTEVTVPPAATVTAPPPPIATVPPGPVQTMPSATAPPASVADAGGTATPAATPSGTPAPIVVADGGGGTSRGAAIPLALSLLGLDVALAGWVIGRRRAAAQV